MIDLPLIEHGAQHGGGKWEVARKIGWDWNTKIMSGLRQAEHAKQQLTNDPNARLTPDEIIAEGRRVMAARGLGNLPFHRYTGA